MIDKKLLESKNITIGNVLEGTHSYIIDKIAKSTNRDLAFITSNTNRARKLHEEIAFLNPSATLFPGWDTTAYDLVSPSKVILEERIQTLSELANSSKQNILILSLDAFIQKTISKDILTRHTLKIKKKSSINREKLIEFLIDNNYTRVSATNEPGEFAVRGSIIDIYTNGEKNGYRLDFFDNQIEYIKIFDPVNQRSLEAVDVIEIIPSSELILSDQYLNNFKSSLLNIAGSKISELDLIESLSEGIKPNAIEQWLPLFYKTSEVISYLKDPIIITDRFLTDEENILFEKIHNLYNNRLEHTKLRKAILPPEYLWISKDQYNNTLKQNQTIKLELSSSKMYQVNLATTNIDNFKILEQQQKADKIELLRNHIEKSYKDKRNIVISSISHGSRDRIARILHDHNISHIITDTLPGKFQAHAHLIISPIENGYGCPEYVLITEQNIFGQTIQNISKKRIATEKHFNELSSLALGELVVHNEYGVARFHGLETVQLSETKHDCIKLEYASENKLFIPVENINLITKYGSADSNTNLDSLGSGSWTAKKARAKEKIKESAQYLMKIAAQRQLQTAEVLEISPGLYEEFCTTFPYVETEDQENAIAEIKADLSSGKSMDRLVCGDTGFGKTEVALRAAFIAIKAGKQVALICPTTLLAKQHFKSFKSRLEKFGIHVSQLSRLVSAKDSRDIIEKINAGSVDLVVGTHALLNDKIKFYNIGLLIIDEEQHFGVAQKEKLKQLKENIHILTLSATPIPRTLQMSLTGIKDLSLISTPPINRMSTKTTIIRFDELIIREALMQEHQRNGQSFYICPRISDLEEVERILTRSVPSLKFRRVHGRMNPSEIDKIMTDFCDGEFDILLCTSIIESGIDIPTANTIIVYKSDQFGLSQMYQIKGRIGRSNIQAYAYFTFTSNKAIKDTTLNKLEILQKADHLGAGFSISSYDMDMRGYGNLVGEAQSGHIKEIGVELYQNILQEEIQALKADSTQKPIESQFTPQINLGIPVYIPEEYITDFDLRLGLYRRLGDIKTEDGVEAFAAEMVDRFGSIPKEFENLFTIIKLKNICYKCKISKLDSNKNGLAITFLNESEKQSDKILKFVLNHKDKIKIKPDNKIVVEKHLSDIERNIYVENFVKALSQQML